MTAILDDLCAAGALADIDRAFATFLAEFDDDPALAQIAALVSAAHRAGHVCLALHDCAGQRIVDVLNALPRGEAVLGSSALSEEAAQARLPPLPALLDALGRSEVVADAGESAIRPLVYDGERLYLHRLFDAERELAAQLRERVASEATTAESDAELARLFPNSEDREAAQAARIAANRRLCIVTGGPGTGKTTLAASIVALLVGTGLAAPRRVALAAPTGRAAARLQESVAARLGALAPNVPAPTATTLHRLLLGDAVRSVDALLVDECSMVDLALATRLLTALPDAARLVLLGDAAQLASVQPGAVFSDLCSAGASSRSPLAQCVTRLTRSHRFDATGGIGRLGAAILSGDPAAAASALADAADEQTELHPFADPDEFDRMAEHYASEWCLPVMRVLRETKQPTTCAPFPTRRVLCAHRRGPFGATRFNRVVERRLRQLLPGAGNDHFYEGRPVIVTRNDRQTSLANGDTGVVVRDETGARTVWFPDLTTPDGGSVLVSPARLPEHESFFALTVHRAQGSEYDEVAFVPGPSDSPVNTRELFYTAITRARRKVIVHATEADIRACVSRATARTSGLLARLS